MQNIIRIFFMAMVFNLSLAYSASDPADTAGSKDPGLFTRMPGFHIYSSQPLEFNKYDFPVAAGKNSGVEGKQLSLIYYANDNIASKLPSGLQIVRNYTNAIKSINGEVVYEYEDGGRQYATMKLVKNGLETWAFIEAGGNGQYSLTLIEKQVMAQVVVADANSLLASIKGTGKAAVYGIYFDTGKADIKPESEKTLKEIAKLLGLDPELKLFVVGHTDTVGIFENNIKLSKDRAASVVKELTTKYSIAAARLRPDGVGPLAPADTNLTDAGKAKNRRVELVAQ